MDRKKQTQENLRASVETLKSELKEARDRATFLESVLDGLDDPVFAKDAQHRWALLNKASCDVMGHPREELIGKSDHDLFPKEQADVFWEKDELVLNSGETNVNEEEITWHGDLHTISTKKSLLTNPESGEKHIVGTIRDITGRKETENRFSIAASLASDIIWEWDIAENHIQWYGDIDALLGMAPGEFGRDMDSFLKLIHFDDRRRLVETLGNHRTSTSPIENFYRIRKNNGSWMHWRDKALPILDADGNPAKWIGVCTDVTDIILTEDSLRNTVSLFAKAQEIAHFGYWEWDPARDVIHWSEETFRLFGRTPENAPSNYEEYMAGVFPDDIEALGQVLKTSVETGCPFINEHRILRPDGEVAILHCVGEASVDEKGYTTKLFGVIHDITERKKAETALAENEMRFRSLFEQSPVAIWEEDFSAAKKIIDGITASGADDLDMYFSKHPGDLETIASLIKILDSNKAAQDTFKTPGRKTFIDAYPGFFREEMMPEFIGFIKNIAEGVLFGQGIEFIANTAEKKAITINLSWSVVPGHEKDYSRIWLYAVDITEDKKMEEALRRHREELEELVAERTTELERALDQLVHAQKMEAVGQLAGGIAHEFNNILATICGTSELLLNGGNIPDSEKPRLERIVKTGARAKDLTMKLLTFARKEKLNISTISSGRLVRDALDMMRGSVTRKIKIETDIPDPAPNVDVDANQIVQALLNICLNACDAMPSGGLLSVSISSREISGIEKPGSPAPGNYCSIRINDSGTGMDERTRDRIFEPFFTTKDRGKGSGLGLSVSHGIIENHGGWILVSSAPGAGSEFEVALPVSELPECNTEEPRMRASRENIRATVMVVDDDADFLETVCETLEFDGFSVIPAPGGKEALSILEKGAPVDVIVLDIMMPETDGAEIFDAIKKISPDLRIVICSGFSMEGVAGELMKKGADAFVQKPFNSNELLNIIAGFVNGNNE